MSIRVELRLIMVVGKEGDGSGDMKLVKKKLEEE